MKKRDYRKIREQLSGLSAEQSASVLIELVEEEVGHLDAEFFVALVETPPPRDEMIFDYAVRGCGSAQVVLGSILIAKEEVAESASEGVFWLARASAGGNGQANFILGGLYAAGRVFEQDTFKAIQHIEKAAVLNLPKAQYMLAVLHLEDDEFYDFDKALMWLKRSSEQGNEKADELLEQLNDDS